MIAYPDSILLDQAPHPIVAHSGMEPDTAAPKSLLSWLLDNQVVLIEEWEELSLRDRERIESVRNSDNMLDAMTKQRVSKGTHRPKAVLTPDIVAAIRASKAVFSLWEKSIPLAYMCPVSRANWLT